jgi:hypothetical protein
MRKRNFRAQVWLNDSESQRLHDNAKRTGLSQENYLRSLINGYAPKELPSVDFYNMIRELRAIGGNINQLAAKANTTGYVDEAGFEREAAYLRKAILEIQKAVTLPEKRSK